MVGRVLPPPDVVCSRDKKQSDALSVKFTICEFNTYCCDQFVASVNPPDYGSDLRACHRLQNKKIDMPSVGFIDSLSFSLSLRTFTVYEVL